MRGRLQLVTFMTGRLTEEGLASFSAPGTVLAAAAAGQRPASHSTADASAFTVPTARLSVAETTAMIAEFGAGLASLARKPKILGPAALISVAYILHAYPHYVQGAYLRMHAMLLALVGESSADEVAVYLAALSGLSLLGTSILILNTALRAHRNRVNFARRIGLT